MKTYKKIWIGLLPFLLLAGMLVAIPKHVFAAAALTQVQSCFDNMKFVDIAHISCDLGDGTAPVIFTDSDPSDKKTDYAPPVGAFCDDGRNTIHVSIHEGNVNLQSRDVGTPISAALMVGYVKSGQSGCTQFFDSNHFTKSVQNTNSLNIILKGGASVGPLDGVTDGRLNVNYTRYLGHDPTNGSVLFSQNLNLTDCSGSILAVNSTGSSGQEFTLGKGGDAFSKYPALENAPPNTGCGVADTNFNFDGNFIISPAATVSSTASSTIHKGDVCTGGSDCSASGTCNIDAGDCTNGGGSDDSNQPATCENKSQGWAFTWLGCPLVGAGQEISDALINSFEDQLSFNVSQDLGGKNNQANVEKTWDLIKNLATAFLVVIMLIMVVSQAIGGGPFDAYTIRKMLPRLVAVAIAIQLSWPLVSWIIDTFDDLGKGLADILYFGFGGADNLTLGKILANAHIGTGTAETISWVGIIGGIGLGIAALPATLMAMLAVVAAVITALVTLVLRKIIIIALLIFSPIALLAYILPNTQKYWKMWLDNFTKILAMFPLVVILIATGRIFAYIVGTQNNGAPVDGSQVGGSFLNFIFIMIGFFGPLFLLPKTYKWGGQAMSLAANGVSGAVNRFAGKESGLGKGVQGFGERKQGQWAKAYDPNKGLLNRGFRRLQSGHAIPFSARSQRLAIASGDKWSQERDDEALALVKRRGEKVLTDPNGYEITRKDADGNFLDKEGNITLNEADAKDTLRGVAAMKQMWIDIADDEKADSNLKKMAVRQLTATSSWPEIQNARSKNGRRLLDTKIWQSAIATSPEDYPKVLRSRVDGAPHIMDGGEKALAAENTKRIGLGQTELEGQAALDFKSQYRINYAIEKQMSNEDFSTQSDGFWEEAARMANTRDASGNLTEGALKIQENLRKRFASIQAAGGTSKQQMLGHLAGGGVQKHVDRALGAGVNVGDYLSDTTVSGSTDKDAVAASWEKTLPSAQDLTDPETRQQYKSSLLRPGRKNPSADALAEGLAYNSATAPERLEHQRVLGELRSSARAAPETTAAYNALVTKIHGAYDQRAAEVVQRAVASNRSAPEVARIKAAADAAAATEKARYTMI